MKCGKGSISEARETAQGEAVKRGYFGIGIYHPKTVHNVGVLWRSAHNFGASFIFTVGHRYRTQASDTTLAWKHVPLFEFASLDAMYEGLPKDCLLIGVEQSAESVDVRRVNHPERAVYLLGAEDYGLPAHVLERCHRVLEIPSTRCLNVGVAGSIVLYDRLMRGTSSMRQTREPVSITGGPTAIEGI